MKNNTRFFVRTSNNLTSTSPTSNGIVVAAIRSGIQTLKSRSSWSGGEGHHWSDPDTGERGDETHQEWYPDPENLGPPPKPVFPQQFPRLPGPPIVYETLPWEPGYEGG